MKKTARIIWGLCFLLVIGLWGCCKKKPVKKQTQPGKFTLARTEKRIIIKLGRIPFKSSREMVQTHEPLMEYLKEALSVDGVKLVLAPNYEGIVKMLREGKIDISWLGTNNYLKAHEETGCEPIVKPIRFGKPYYSGDIIVRVDSNINKLGDLKGKRIAFVDKGSASGYVYPMALFIKNGFNPAKDFKEISFLGEHDSVVWAVFYKKYDAGAVYTGAIKNLKDKEKEGMLKVIAHTIHVPNEPIVVARHVDRAMRQKILKAFLDCNDKNPLGKKVLTLYNKVGHDQISGFVEAKDKDYDPVREVQKLLKVLNNKASTE